ncbi:MAG TPA: tetratricopeptide repeat protein, partial [Chloroflexia bacterium]|nr:tetratricopeptide repeat protein [Chloroflexia bacterium]
MAERSLTNIPLQEAYSRAKVALEAGTPDRAIAITHHILRYYPQYLDAYRLLGEAYLERGQPDEALRFFTHVLNADPQNVLAYIGKAIIADDRGQVDIAIDAYERAFEMDPSITELRSELLRLYKIRYGSAGATIRTTPSGLAYVHLRAGLRDAAITELGYVAQTRPDRWDIEVALAEALWRNEQLDEAAAVAGDILAGHPTCVKCNWLLGYIHWTGGRTGNGRKYFLDALAHDPTYRIANTIWAATPWPLDRAVTRRQPALVPIWSTAELAGSDLDLSLAYPAITEPAPGPAPAPPPEAPEPVAIAMAATEAGPVEEGLPAPAESAAEDLFDAMPEEEVMLPGPMDLEWFDDWVLDAEMVPPPAPTLAAEPEVVEVPAEPLAPALGDAAQPVMQAMDAAEGEAAQDGAAPSPAATDEVASQDEAAFSLVQELEAVEAAVDGAEREGARAADEQSKLTEAAAEEELATTSEISELSDLAEAAGQEAPNPGTPAEREEMPAAASAAEAPEPAVVSVETEDSITGVIDAQASDDVVAIAQDEIPGEPALEDSASHEPLPGDVGDAEAAGHELEHRTAAELPIPAGESPPASSRADLAAVAIMAAGELGVIADLDAPATLLPAGEIVTVRGPDT